MASNNFQITKKYLKTYGDQVESEIETRLKNYGKYATGNLYDSIRYTVTEDSNKFRISFFMADYGQWVDKGSKPSKYANMTGKGKGKSKFIESLMIWCRIKGIPEGAAFPIRRKIWKEGLPPTNFFTIPTTRRVKQLNEGIRKAMIQDAEAIIKKEFGKKK